MVVLFCMSHSLPIGILFQNIFLKLEFSHVWDKGSPLTYISKSDTNPKSIQIFSSNFKAAGGGANLMFMRSLLIQI